jgi:hypothetical protein
MKKVLCFIILFGIMVIWAQKGSTFVYNEHGKKDPFSPMISSSGTLIPYDNEISESDISLEGVVLDAKGNNLAIMNGKIVKAADKVGAYTVDTIASDHVNLVKGDERLTVKLKKGAQ